MSDDTERGRTADLPEGDARTSPELVLVEAAGDPGDARRLAAPRRKPPLPTLHLTEDEILPFPAA